MAGEAQIRLAGRQVIGLAIYRSAANLALLTYGFIAFPEHKTVFALAVITFSLGITALGETQRITHLLENHVLDRADRKTRHTVTVAQEWALRGQGCDDYTFWGEVDDRVAAEIGPEDPKTPLWRAIGLTMWNVLSHLLADLALVFFALLFSGNT